MEKNEGKKRKTNSLANNEMKWNETKNDAKNVCSKKRQDIEKEKKKLFHNDWYVLRSLFTNK